MHQSIPRLLFDASFPQFYREVYNPKTSFPVKSLLDLEAVKYTARRHQNMMTLLPINSNIPASLCRYAAIYDRHAKKNAEHVRPLPTSSCVCILFCFFFLFILLLSFFILLRAAFPPACVFPHFPVDKSCTLSWFNAGA